jgi:AbiV family abortive infection protein
VRLLPLVGATQPIVRLILDGTVARVRLDRKATAVAHPGTKLLELGFSAIRHRSPSRIVNMSSMSNSPPIPSIKSWEELVEAFAQGQLPIFETIKAVQPIIFEKGDHEGFVNFTRAMHMMMRDVRLLERLIEEMGAEYVRVTGNPYTTSDFDRLVRSKDGPRLMGKLGTVQAEMFGDGPPLLSGRTFKECLDQYHRLVGQVESLWSNACSHYRAGKFALCTFLSILAIEEIAKLGRLWYDLLAWDRPLPSDRKDLRILGRDHRKKHFLGVISGAVINSRLDRVLGHKPIKQVLQDAESGKLESLRQSCLYIDLHDGRPVTPDDVISQDTARFFAVLAGELWAEILGHFPWEFEMMLEKVMAFEIEIGFAKELIRSVDDRPRACS